MSFKCLASQRMFQPVSRVTENEIREDVPPMAFGAGSTPVIHIFDFGAFPWSVSKTESPFRNSTCVQRELLTHGSVLQTFESKKMTKVILTRVELNSWIDLCCVFLKNSRRFQRYFKKLATVIKQ